MDAMVPQYVRPQRATLLLLLMAGATLGCLGCRTNSMEKVMTVSPRREKVDPVPTELERLTAKRVSADEIYTVYNRKLIIGALPNQKYRDYLMWVSGVFNGVNRNLPGRPYLELRTHDDASFVYAALSADDAPLMNTLVPGTSVALLCWGDDVVVGNPFLRDCRR
jgi:hypothetical protein